MWSKHDDGSKQIIKPLSRGDSIQVIARFYTSNTRCPRQRALSVLYCDSDL